MTSEKSSRLSVLDVVALLADLPAEGLSRGQVGTVVEMVGKDKVLVEFSGDDGRAYAIVACPIADLLVLHYVPEAAA
jgi:catabolite regulation protein CreA